MLFRRSAYSDPELTTNLDAHIYTYLDILRSVVVSVYKTANESIQQQTAVHYNSRLRTPSPLNSHNLITKLLAVRRPYIGQAQFVCCDCFCVHSVECVEGD
jgi:hypothetical protein